ncbi:hypothetical protein D3C76_454340 [compost metagenome]
MGQVGEHVHSLAFGGQGLAQAVFNEVEQVVDIAPVSGGFEGVDHVTGVPQVLAQVGETEAVLRPLLAEQGAGEHAAEGLEVLSRLFQRQRVLPTIAGHAEGQQALARTGAAQFQILFQPGDLLRMTGQRQLRFGFHGVGQAQHRQRNARLSQLADGLQCLGPRGQKYTVETLIGRQRTDPHLDLGNDPETALATQHHFAQIRPGGRGRKGWNMHRPGEGFQRSASE